MAITASEFTEMLRLWEQCCFDVGDSWRIASKRLHELEKKAGRPLDCNYNDFEQFHVQCLGLLGEVA